MLTSQDDGRSVLRKPWGLGRRIAVASAMFLGLGFLVFATAGANEEGRLTGAGSTFVNPILQRVSTSYQSYLAADRVNMAAMKAAAVTGLPGRTRWTTIR